MRYVFSLAFVVLVLVPYLFAESPEPEVAPSKMDQLYQQADWTVLKAPIEGPIGPATLHYLENVFDELESTDAQAVVLEINTPGGLLTSTREIIQLINSSQKPVITLVGPSGARGGICRRFYFACRPLGDDDGGHQYRSRFSHRLLWPRPRRNFKEKSV
jgi:membrane-bound ClpP family serine protease